MLYTYDISCLHFLPVYMFGPSSMTALGVGHVCRISALDAKWWPSPSLLQMCMCMYMRMNMCMHNCRCRLHCVWRGSCLAPRRLAPLESHQPSQNQEENRAFGNSPTKQPERMWVHQVCSKHVVFSFLVFTKNCPIRTVCLSTVIGHTLWGVSYLIISWWLL